MNSRTVKENGVITIWNETEEVGLQFKEGETLSGYTAAIILSNPSIIETEEGAERVAQISNILREQAAKEYPKEFNPIK